MKVKFLAPVSRPTVRQSATRTNLKVPSGGIRAALMALVAATLGSLALLRPALGQDKEAPKPTADPARTLFAAHCQDCHSGPKPKGDFLLSSLTSDFADAANRERWEKVAEQLKSGAMPPSDKSRPPATAIKAGLDWIGAQLAAAPASTKAAARPGMRRLSRTEYANTVRDLLEVDVDLEDLLPADPTSGFENNAESLHVSSYLLESYMKAADRVLDEAIASGPKPWANNRRLDLKNEKSIKPTGSVYRYVDDGVAIFSSSVAANIQVTLWQYMTRARGKYRFRISGYGYQTVEPVVFHVKVGPMNAAAQQTLIGYYDVPPGMPTVVEFTKSIDPNQTIRIVADGLKASTRDVEKIGADNYKGPGLVVQWVDIEGPLIDTWPPPSYRRLFGDLPQQRVSGDQSGRSEVVSQKPLEDAGRILRNFVGRAFRRPVTDADVAPFVARVKAKLDEQRSFEESLRVGLQAVLLSPQFLFHREPSGRLDDYALACRLSYFLWSSMPDDELFALAEKGTLREPETLRGQVERMLNDEKAAAFTNNFASQWLNLGAIDATMPDRMLYPEFDDVLKESCVKETLLFFDEVLKNNLSLTNFVSSDFAMINGRLAELYGIAGIKGLQFQKVPLAADGRRGGVLTMASVLKVSANGTTTSPVLRGAWVLERILGTPPPKPTVDVEAVEPDIRGATTIRDQLAKHRGRPECASCHAIIDPPGFALENYDVIGGWRDRYRSIGQGDPAEVDGRKMRYRHGPHVDASDVMVDGRRFANIGEFRQLLLDDPDQLARALAEKLLAYATGTAPT
ncbi:hypothetical protein AYO47_08715, partial [Planctomyces sp. SCGC AG-212-M04]